MVRFFSFPVRIAALTVLVVSHPALAQEAPTTGPGAAASALVAGCAAQAAHPQDEGSAPEGVAFADIDPEAAIAACAKARAVYPDHGPTAYNLARAFQAGGFVQDARDAFVAALDAGPCAGGAWPRPALPRRQRPALRPRRRHRTAAHSRRSGRGDRGLRVGLGPCQRPRDRRRRGRSSALVCPRRRSRCAGSTVRDGLGRRKRPWHGSRPGARGELVRKGGEGRQSDGDEQPRLASCPGRRRFA